MAYFQKKACKSEEQKKTMIDYHTRSTFPKEHWLKGYIDIVSIDPGIVNFGFRVERRYNNGHVQTIGMQRKCFSKDTIQEGDYNSLYMDVIAWLNNYLSYITSAHVIVVEKQLHINYQTTRLAQAVITYALLMTSGSPIQPIIAEIDSKAKYKMLNAPKGLNDKGLKQWGIEYALKLLEMRGEVEVVKYIAGEKGVRGQSKHDDLCDVIIQVEAFMLLCPIIENQLKNGNPKQ